MKKIIFLILLSLSVYGFSANNKINAAGGLDWFTNYNDALANAEKRDTLILINFTGSDWCSWCFKLDKNVFSTDEFHTWVKENVTLLYLDFPQKKKLDEAQVKHNKILAELYSVSGFPTIVFLDSKGRLLTKTGYDDNADFWIKNVEANIAYFKKYTTFN